MKTKFVAILALMLATIASAQDKKWTLQECVDYAVKNNLTIQQQELSNNLLGENVTVAEGNFYPSLGAYTSLNYNFGSFIDVSGSRISADSRSNNFGLSTNVTLFNGFSNKYNLELAKKQLKAAGFDLDETKNNIMLYVVNAYLNVLLNRENLKINEDLVAITKNQVKVAKDLVDAGSKPESSLLEAQATLATNEQQLTTAQNTLDLALLSLAQLLHLPQKGFNVQPVDVSISDAALLYNDTDVIFQKALSNLPEIKSAELGIENSKLSVKIAKSAYYPSLSLGAGMGTVYQHKQGEPDLRTVVDQVTNQVIYVPNGFSKQLQDNLGYNIGLTLNIPIFNNFRTKASVNRAKINQNINELKLQDKKQTLRESIEKAYADAKAALKQYTAAQKSMQSQELLFKNAQVSYNNGVMTSFDFEQVKNGLVNAQASMINAKYNFIFRTKLLEYYYGIQIRL